MDGQGEEGQEGGVGTGRGRRGRKGEATGGESKKVEFCRGQRQSDMGGRGLTTGSSTHDVFDHTGQLPQCQCKL